MGGRGSSDDRGSTASSRLLDQETSEAWSEDPALYQALSDPERAESRISQMKQDGWEDDEIKEIQEMAVNIRDLSETQVVRGVSTLYRGERFDSLAQAQRKYTVGNSIETSQLTSYADNEELAKEYATIYSNKVAVIIKNTNKSGDFVGVRLNHSGYDKNTDPEVITPKGLKSTVKSTRFDKSTNTLYVTMENTATPRRKR